MNLAGLKAFGLNEVTLEDKYLVNAYGREVDYLLSLDTDRLLAGFRDTAGVDMRGAARYGGWENMLIGGHTLGHYVAACVQAYETANATEEQRKGLLRIIVNTVNGLKECQDALGTGFIFGATIPDRDNLELQFDRVERNETNIITQSWVPWYTMHKIFEGLVAMAELKSASGADDATVSMVNATALEVASRLADWTYGRTSSWSAETHKTVLSIEFGGMNDCLYDVYLLTGREEHLEAAKAFDQDTLYMKVYSAKAGDNILNNHHANTTIPKFVGAVKRYIVTGEAEYFEYADSFWNMVTANHTYVTGGNSEWEHFGLDRVLDAERTNCNCETCNVYNMLKLTKLLFEQTGDEKYADWYENTFINSILSSQNPDTGMTTYFQPMASGYFKVYGERTDKFWCCIGTGMENFSKLGESFYFHKDGAVVVNQYFSSKLASEIIELTQQSSIPVKDKSLFTFNRDYTGKILFRLPDWLADSAVIKVDGIQYNYAVTGAEPENGVNGYAIVDGTFGEGATVEVTLPMHVVAYNLPDNDRSYAFKYGPVVLSALLGTDDMETSTTGVDVTIPKTQILSKLYLPGETETVTLADGLTVDDFIVNINDYMVRDESAEYLRFTLTGTTGGLTYVTHYSQHKERYGLYLKFEEGGENKEEPVVEETEAPAEESAEEEAEAPTEEEKTAEEQALEEELAEELSGHSGRRKKKSSHKKPVAKSRAGEFAVLVAAGAAAVGVLVMLLGKKRPR